MFKDIDGSRSSYISIYKCMPSIMQVQPTLSHTGFIVAFSLLVVKSWRTYRIFHNTKQTDKVRGKISQFN